MLSSLGDHFCPISIQEAEGAGKAAFALEMQALMTRSAIQGPYAKQPGQENPSHVMGGKRAVQSRSVARLQRHVDNCRLRPRACWLWVRMGSTKVLG